MNTLPTDEEKIQWLRLYRSENVGPQVFFHCLERFGSVEKALNSIALIGERGGKTLNILSFKEAEKEYRALKKIGGELITFHDPLYPENLRAIHAPPPLLSVLGKTELLKVTKKVAFVGARKASLAGAKLTTNIVEGLSKRNYVFVSGMARGIDTAMHQASLEAGTIAVLGCGVDVVYPEENEELYKNIKNMGVLVSEFPLGTPPAAYNFPKRNRIIAGLAQGVVVIEAAARSGSLLTASYANEAGRVVCAVPGSPLDPRSRGGNQLIKEGAHLVENAEDVLNAIEIGQEVGSLKEERANFEHQKIHATVEEIEKAKEVLLSLLSYTPTNVAELQEYAKLPYFVFAEALIELELLGQITRSFGASVALK